MLQDLLWNLLEKDLRRTEGFLENFPIEMLLQLLIKVVHFVHKFITERRKLTDDTGKGEGKSCEQILKMFLNFLQPFLMFIFRPISGKDFLRHLPPRPFR